MTIEKKRKETFLKEDYCRCERSFGTFMRRFEMPGNLDIEKIKESVKKHKKIAIR